MRLKADLSLLLVSVIWGSAFAAQRIASLHFSSFFFNGSRFLLGALVLLPFTKLPWKIEKKMLPWVALAGLLLVLGSGLQQAGLQWTTSANAGFITALYVVLIPIIVVIFWRQKLRWISWLAALVAVLGADLLSMGPSLLSGTGLHFSIGDGLELLGAIAWALHVILVSRIVHKMNVLHFCVGQYTVAGLVHLALALFGGMPTLEHIGAAWWTIAYVGIFSVGLGYTLQSLSQKYSPPADAALIMSLESVFAALFGFLLLNERLEPIQIFGCAIILAAVIAVQVIPGRAEQIPVDLDPEIEPASLAD